MKNTVKLIIIVFGLFVFNNLSAQKIIQFSQYKIVKSKYGTTKIEIKPHTRSTNVGKNESKYNSNFGIYGVLICYSVNGEKKAARQDMTSDLKKYGVYDFTLAYGSKVEVSNVSVTYFNMVDKPKSNWPEKGDCF